MTTFPFAGSISHGTLRTEDLLQTFYDVLVQLDKSASALFGDQVQTAVNALDGTYDNDPEYTEEEVADLVDGAGELLAELEDELHALAPKGYRFGAHEGDGSDFGFWPVSDVAEAFRTLSEKLPNRSDLNEAVRTLREHLSSYTSGDADSVGVVAMNLLSIVADHTNSTVEVPFRIED